MRNKICIISKVVGCMLTAFVWFLPAVADQTVTIGGSAGHSVTYEKISNTDTAGVALYFPASYMQAYKGCHITSIQLQLYDKTTTDGLCLFVSHSLNGTKDYEQKTTAKTKSLDISLDTPYEIDGKGLYIGYTVVGEHYLCYSNSIATGEEWIWRKSDGWTRYTKTYSATLTAKISGDNLPENVRLNYLYMPDHAITSTSIPMTGEILNLGASTVNSLTFTYLIDGQEAGSETVEGLSIAQRNAGSFTLSSLKISDESQPKVGISITKVNGRDDAIMTDNTSRQQSILCRKNFTKRNVLLEVFSTELCPNCPSTHALLQSLLGNKTDVIEVGHHSGFYTDDFTAQASVDYEWFYKTSRLYAPAMMMNRSCLADNYPSFYSDSVPIVQPSDDAITALYNEFRYTPAYATVNISKTYDTSTRHLKLHIDGTQLLPWATPDSLKLYVMLTEDSIYTESQRGAASGFYHRYALRDVLTDTWGDPIDITSGYSKDYETDIPTTWNDSQMRAVAFVANYNATDNNDCRVLNAEQVKLIEAPTVVASTLYDDSFSIEGHTVKAQTGAQISVYGVSGRCIKQGRSELSLHNLPSGVYIIKCGNCKKKITL